MSKGSISALLSLAVMLAVARVAFAGGFYLAVETPRAGDPDTKDAVLLVRPYGCHQPADAKLSATAEGIVDGKRTSVALELKPTAAGVYAIKQQWPAHGSWVVVITGDYNGMTSSLLIDLAPDGKVHPDTHLAEGNMKGTHVRSARKQWSSAQVDAALKTPGGVVGQTDSGSSPGTGTLAVAGVGTAVSLIGFVALRRRAKQSSRTPRASQG